MPPTIPDRLADVHPQMLRVQGEADRKKLVGRLVERTFELMSLSKQDAAWRMGYRDPGVVSRWCSGVERPCFDKLIGLDGFEDAWLLAIAERNPRMEVVTQIVVRRQSA